jgi:seryl-tRNA synthetase
MENNSIIPNISHNILINFVPETEKQKVEEELENYKKKLKDSENRINVLEAELSRTSLSIKTYIELSNITVLRDDFLNYCNKIWEDDEEINKIFTDDIFSILTCSSTDFY